MKKRPELMSPIKNRAGFEACKDYADAVYFGVSEFNLRSNSKGIDVDELKDFMKLCHRNRVKGYLTVNSSLYNYELSAVEDLMKRAQKAKVDAVIVWDPAAIRTAKRLGLKFFISTQANVSNWKAAKFYEDLGAKRVILSREMSLEQISQVKKKTALEVEAFIHGAMCIAISGRCLLSAFYENKSANKGACNQLCRRKWWLTDEEGKKLKIDGKYFLSPKDICMIEYLPEMIDAGIDSFKIEGRQRDARYVRETAKYYRKAIDAHCEGDFNRKKAKKWKKELKKVYNRNFTTGFYFGEPGGEGINFEFSGSAATQKKIQVGKVTNFYSRIKVASVELLHRGLEVGDKILIEGETTYCQVEISSLQINGKEVTRAEKGEEVGIKLSTKARKKDKVFILVE